MNESLPETAYVKMLDVWMLAAMLLPFSEIIALVLSKEISCMRTNGGIQFSETPSDSKLSAVRTEFLTAGRQGGKLSRQNPLEFRFYISFDRTCCAWLLPSLSAIFMVRFLRRKKVKGIEIQKMMS